MTHDEDLDPARRRLLLAALGGMGAGLLSSAASLAAGIPDRRSVYLLKGAVRINAEPASQDTFIKGGDLVETGNDGQIVFRVESDAFILRPNSRLQLTPPPDNSLLVQGLRLVTGGLLSVFAKRPHYLAMPTATIGIRGTGVYCEVEPDRDYVCTCYGITELGAAGDPQSRDTVDAGYHEPRYILHDAPAGQRIRKAGFRNHSDEELTLIESLVGRTPAFRGRGEGYQRPRRRTY
jgi:hypothetical protein